MLKEGENIQYYLYIHEPFVQICILLKLVKGSESK